MSDLDAKLIREFEQVPALYDRNDKKFKDKAFVERAWNNIAHTLCYDVNILKDRMYQLRNRFNLEKRKLQALRDDGLPNPKSMWPLFHNLNFLSSHIRQRKSYKAMRTLAGGTGFRGFTKAEGRSSFLYAINRAVVIKKEVGYQFNYNDNGKLDANESIVTNDNDKTSQTLRNIKRLQQSLLAEDNDSGIATQEKIQEKEHHPSQKFKAFGVFVSDSLQDLPKQKALTMIDKFTSEIVQALIADGLESCQN